MSGTSAEAELHARLATDPGEVPRARRMVADVVTAWAVPADLDVVLLLTSELVTNALLHGSPPLELRAFPLPQGLHVEVRDGAAGRDPRPQHRLAQDDLTGRGLALVELLSDRWGWRQVAYGKLVWFEVDA
jgi:anti-sigma regulatory factor (Ser/Thr protein kinase)